MASQGSKAYAAEYNSLYNSVNYVLGSGSGAYGYGQTLNSITTSVTSSDRITRAHWANLRLDLLRIAGHQGLAENGTWTVGTTSSIPTLPTVTSTTRISANIVNSFNNAISVLTLSTNAYKLAVGQYSDELLTSSTRSTSWNGSINHYFTLNFGSADNARYFFNAGGSVRITPSMVLPNPNTGVGASINQDWYNLISGVGTIVFGYTDTTISGTQVSSIGFYDLTSTPTQIYTRTGGTQNATYAVNDYTVLVYCDVLNNSGGTATSVTFRCQFNDDKGYVDPLWPSGDEPITGSVTNSARMYRPSGANVAVTAPAVTVTSNL